MSRWIPLLFVFFASCAAEEIESIDDDRCHAPSGVDASPNSIEAALELMDSLPRPVTVGCFVESLERPMTITGSYDVFSAQPAAGFESPRIFAMYDQLILSFVPAGDGSHVIEFAEERPLNLSVKAEVLMPIEGELVPADAFEHIKRERGGTICGTCHSYEEPATDITYADAFVSEALRPARSEIATLEEMLAQHESCDPDETPERCEIYDGLFGPGDVHEGEFPRPLPTIYD